MSSKITRRDLSNDINELLDTIEGYQKIIDDLKAEINKLRDSIPLNLSQLENDTNFITAEDESITSKAPLNDPSFIGTITLNEDEVVVKNDIPTKVSQLENDSRFITAENEVIKSKAPLENPEFSGTMTINNFNVARTKDIPTKISQLKNDMKFIANDDISITNKANKATSGFNTSIADIESYPFGVTGDKSSAAGITFDRGKYRVNFGIDVDNKLKIGGGNSDELRDIIDSENLLDSLFERGLYLVSLDFEGNLILLNKNERYRLIYNEISKIFSLEKIR